MYRLIPLLGLCLAACGLADDPRDEENKHNYIVFTDSAFEAYCLREADTNQDGRISRYEAQRVLHIDCANCGIGSLWEIGEFFNLRTLRCSGNAVPTLDLRKCTALEKLSCGDNALLSLDVNGLRSLTELDCSANRLTRLDLQSNASLQTLRCSSNPLTVIDVSACASAMQEVDARSCPLTVFYRASGQEIRTLRLDDLSVVAEQ